MSTIDLDIGSEHVGDLWRRTRVEGSSSVAREAPGIATVHRSSGDE